MSEMFELAEGGVGVMPDPDDNPDGHVVPHSGAGVLISVELANVGDATGVATVGIEVDDVWVTDRTSEPLDPGGTAVAYVSLGRLAPGTHTILAYVNPGSGQHDHRENTIELP